ncbi:MAG: glucose 1-dehydrogenase [Anaerolineae bacterium]|nr:glucose 1-dehydrogenase [Anaerolineae bacterium]
MMDIRFDGQIAMVTGSSTGIGAAIAQAFAASGAKVAVHYNRSEAEANSVAAAIEAAGGDVFLVQADVTIPEQVKRLVDQTMNRFGRIDVLINNAGALVERRAVHEVDDDLYNYIMDVNITQTFQVCRLVIPIMQKQGHGNIINLTSIAARNGGGGGSVLYASAKAAVSTFTRGLAKELAQQNIRVNAISPGLIQTPFHDRFTSPERMKVLVGTIPMGRVGKAEECAGTALFLASDAMSSYITGQIIEVNGGQYTP